jgi:hypothetical protein
MTATLTAGGNFLHDPFGSESMDEIDSTPAPSDGTSSEPAGNTPRSVAAGPEQFPVGTSRLLVYCLVAGLLAGTGSLLAGEAIMHHYGADLSPPVERKPSPEEIKRWHDARLYCPATIFATMGGFLGLAMGMAGGLARGSVFRGAWAAIVGLLLGTIVATSASLISVSLFYKKHDPTSGDLVFPMLMHGTIWSAVGAIGGLAFGLALGREGRWKATLLGGLVGAAAATVVYEVVGALAFATDKTDLPLAASMPTRAMAHLLVAILSAVGAVVVLRQSPTRQVPSSLPS